MSELIKIFSDVGSFVSYETLVLLMLGLVVGLLSGLLGVGGGVLMTPALHLMGLSMPMAVGTTLTQMIASSLSASFRHHRKKNLSILLAILFAVPALLGVSLGRELMTTWSEQGVADQYAGKVYVAVLVYIGIVMTRRQVSQGSHHQESLPTKVRFWNKWVGQIKAMITGFGPKIFIKSLGQSIPLLVPCLCGFFVGVTSALTGLGGGFFYVPLMVTLLYLPFRLAVGTSVMTVLFISTSGAFSYATAGLVDYRIAVLAACGSSIGAYLGASAAHYIHGQTIRNMFVALLWLAALSMSLHLMHYSTFAHVLLFSGAGCVVMAAVVNAAFHFCRARF